MHCAIDDHTRLAHAEIHPDERAETCAGFGKAERFNRTLLEEWAYARPFLSGSERAEALPTWLHTYNHHRTHTSLHGQPPISRLAVNDLAGHYIQAHGRRPAVGRL